MDLFKQREDLRDQIKLYWKEGRSFGEAENAVSKLLNEVHAECIKLELLDENKPKERIVYSVCGYSDKHGYFRTKRFTSLILDEAIAEFEKLKNDPDWRIPTLIVKETHLRKNSGATTDFDGKFEWLGFSDSQEIIDKHMCGSRSFTWKYLIGINEDRFTY